LDAISLPRGDDSIVHKNFGQQVEVRSLIVAVPQAQPDVEWTETREQTRRTAAVRAADVAFPFADLPPRISSSFAQSRRVDIGRGAGTRRRESEVEVSLIENEVEINLGIA